jgi:NitT/TauT family transport system substrate-binding protein
VGPAAPPQPAAAPPSLTIATPSRSLSQFPLYVAIQRGFFKEQRLEVQLMEMTPPAQIAAVGSGELDYTTAIGSAAQANARGLSVRVFLVTTDKPQHVLVATPDIQSVQELAGRTVGITARGSTTDHELQVVLALNGLAAGSVQTIPLGIRRRP